MWKPLLLAIFITWTGLAQDWRTWAPRAEIAPKSSTENNGRTLVLEGAGNPAVCGGWERAYPGIQPGSWYQLTARYQARGLDYEPLQVLVRMDWTSSTGRRAGQPEYAWRTTSDGASTRVTVSAPAPEGAAAVKAQLLLLNAPRAIVRWSDIEVKEIPAPQPRKVAIAAIRLRPKGADPVARFIELAEKQVHQPADVILLPEGITVVGTAKTYADVAEPVPGETTKRLGVLARNKKAWVAAGVYEREGAAVYNTAVLIDRQGNLAGKYRKVYIPREETEGGITAGAEYPVFDTDFGRVGMMICWDVQYADPARGVAVRGAELLLMPIWGGNETLAKARAIENHLFLATSGYDFPSLVFDPLGETLARTETDGDVAWTVIDLNRRYADKWLGEMRGRFFKELRGDVRADPAGRK